MTIIQENDLRQILVCQQRQIYALQSSEIAFKKIIKKLADAVPPSVAETLREFEDLRKAAWQDQMIKLEDLSPSFAVHIDQGMPPI